MVSIPIFHNLQYYRINLLIVKRYRLQLRQTLAILLYASEKENKLFEGADFKLINIFWRQQHIKASLKLLLGLGYFERTEFKTKYRITSSGENVVNDFRVEYKRSLRILKPVKKVRSKHYKKMNKLKSI